MGYQYDASGVHFEVGGLDRKDDTRAPRKGRACRQIAAAEAEVAETATHGRVVLLGFGKMAAQPLANDVALLVGGVFETDTGLIAIASPCQLSIDFELLIHAWQFEREAKRVLLRDAAGKLNSHAAFAQVDGLGLVAARAVTHDRKLHRHSQRQSPCNLHQ